MLEVVKLGINIFTGAEMVWTTTDGPTVITGDAAAVACLKSFLVNQYINKGILVDTEHEGLDGAVIFCVTGRDAVFSRLTLEGLLASPEEYGAEYVYMFCTDEDYSYQCAYDNTQGSSSHVHTIHCGELREEGTDIFLDGMKYLLHIK